jgi:hypothetical protein
MSSNLISGLLGIVSIICCLIILSLPVSITIKASIIGLIIASSIYFILRDALLLLPWSWQSIEVNCRGELSMTNKRGHKFQPALASNCFIQANLIILNFKRKEFKFALPPVILFANVENTDELRRLRIWLRWFKHDIENQEDLNIPDSAA